MALDGFFFYTFLLRCCEPYRTGHDLDLEMILIDDLTVQRIGKSFRRIDLYDLRTLVDDDILELRVIQVLTVRIWPKKFHKTEA